MIGPVLILVCVILVAVVGMILHEKALEEAIVDTREDIANKLRALARDAEDNFELTPDHLDIFADEIEGGEIWL